MHYIICNYMKLQNNSYYMNYVTNKRAKKYRVTNKSWEKG